MPACDFQFTFHDINGRILRAGYLDSAAGQHRLRGYYAAPGRAQLVKMRVRWVKRTHQAIRCGRLTLIL
jgi:hypothetical protein